MLAWANQVLTTLQKRFTDLSSVIGSRVTIVLEETGNDKTGIGMSAHGKARRKTINAVYPVNA
jgi:hypothetical protein